MSIFSYLTKNALTKENIFKSQNIPILLTGLFFILIIYLAFKNSVIVISDSFGFIGRAENLSFNNSSSWVDPFYPFGYPFLLKFFFKLTGDYLVAAKIISVFAGLFCLIYVYKIANLLYQHTVAIFSLIFLGLNPVFLKYASIDGTDMIAVAFMLAFIYYLLYQKEKESFKYLIVAGVCLGLGYLIRYTSLILLPCGILWLLTVSGSATEKKNKIAILIISFLLIAGPQLILSKILHNDYFWNLQYMNVWFGIYGNKNFGLAWSKAGDYHSLSEVFFINPSLFINNMFTNVKEALKLRLVNVPFYYTYSFLLGALGICLDKKAREKGVLLLVCFIAYVIAISMAFIGERLLLFLVPIEAIVSVYGFIFLLNNDWSFFKKHYNTIIITCLSIIAFSYIFRDTIGSIKNPYSDLQNGVIAVSNKLHQNGMKNSSEVLEFSYDFYDVDSPRKDRFNIPWHANPSFSPYQSMNDIKMRMAKAKERFLVYTKDSQWGIPGLLTFWDTKTLPKEFSILYDKDGVTVLQLNETYLNTSNIATPEDFKKFVSTNPLPMINETSYQDPASKDYFFNLFQENGNWTGQEWHRDNVLPLWRKYKKEHKLL